MIKKLNIFHKIFIILYFRRKRDSMQPHNLFSLLADRLLLHPNGFTMSTYNILFEVISIIIMKYIDLLFYIDRYLWKKSVDQL